MFNIQQQHVVGSVYRVHFQLVQMFDCYCKLVSSVAGQAANSSQVSIVISHTSIYSSTEHTACVV